MVLFVYFVDVLVINVRGVVAIFLMLFVHAFLENCVEHSVSVSIVDEAFFKSFDRVV